MKTITRNSIKMLLPRRARDAHKGIFGHVILYCGSLGMVGAAILSARAALRSGAGLVTVAIDEKLFTSVHAGVPEATCVERKVMDLSSYDAVAVGPGIGSNIADDAGSGALVKRLIECCESPLILDADALNCVSHAGSGGCGAKFYGMDKTKASIVVTPHVGEAARLLGTNAFDVQEDREGAVRALACDCNAVAVLKGSDTLVCGSDEILMNSTGNPGMATGGSGDVLTGMITAFAAQGHTAIEAASMGVYLHGLAGDIAAESVGEYGLIASDIIESIPAAIHRAACEQ